MSGAQCQVRSRYSTCTSDITYWQCKLATIALHSLAFPPSSVWLLAVCKNGSGRPGPFYHMNDVSIYLGRQSVGVPNHNPFCARVLHFVVRFLLHKCSKLKHLGQKLQDKASRSFFRWENPPLCLYSHHSHDNVEGCVWDYPLWAHPITNTWSHVHVHVHM